MGAELLMGTEKWYQNTESVTLMFPAQENQHLNWIGNTT